MLCELLFNNPSDLKICGYNINKFTYLGHYIASLRFTNAPGIDLSELISNTTWCLLIRLGKILVCPLYEIP